MTRIGIAVRLLFFAAIFLLMAGPHALSLRRKGDLARWCPVVLHRLFLWLFGIRVFAKGVPPPNGPALVLANHASWLDIPVLGSRRPLSSVAKAEVAGWPIVGLFAKLQRCIFLDRTRRTATAAANARVAGRLADGDMIVLFPEGTSSDGNRILPFRSSLVGAAQAALAEPRQRRIALQPVAIYYARRCGLPVTRVERPAIGWYGDMDLLPHVATFLLGGPIDAIVVWGEPIPFDARSERKRVAAQAEAAVRALRDEVTRPRTPMPPYFLSRAERLKTFRQRADGPLHPEGPVCS